jgi:hypothetical protein
MEPDSYWTTTGVHWTFSGPFWLQILVKVRWTPVDSTRIPVEFQPDWWGSVKYSCMVETQEAGNKKKKKSIAEIKEHIFQLI